MTFEVEVAGRTRTVAVEGIGAAGPDGGRFRVRIDGVALEVSARPTDLGLSLLFEPGGRSVEAAVTPVTGGASFVQLSNVSLTAVVDGRRQPRAEVDAVSGKGAQRLTAPMPGRVVRVLVAVGDAVEPRQGLVVVEAMKMENELTATRAGTVKEVHVAEGASVEAGRLLVVVE